MHQRTYRIEQYARFGRDDTALLNVMDLLCYASITIGVSSAMACLPEDGRGLARSSPSLQTQRTN